MPGLPAIGLVDVEGRFAVVVVRTVALDVHKRFAEVAIHELIAFCQKRAEQAKEQFLPHSGRTQHMCEQLNSSVEACMNTGGLSYLLGRSRKQMRTLMDHLAAFARQYLAEAVAHAGVQFYLQLAGRLEERLRELVESRAPSGVAAGAEPERAPTAPIVDIAEALRKSLEMARKPAAREPRQATWGQGREPQPAPPGARYGTSAISSARATSAAAAFSTIGALLCFFSAFAIASVAASFFFSFASRVISPVVVSIRIGFVSFAVCAEQVLLAGETVEPGE